MGEVLKSSTFSSGPNDKMKWSVLELNHSLLFLFICSLYCRIKKKKKSVTVNGEFNLKTFMLTNNWDYWSAKFDLSSFMFLKYKHECRSARKG